MSRRSIATLALLAAGSCSEAGGERAEATRIELRETADATYALLLPGQRAGPAPTLLLFASTRQETLEHPLHGQVARALASRGVVSVSLDLPAHGRDARPGEGEPLAAWASRLERGEDLLGPFLLHAGRVLDRLVADGTTDPGRVAACGISRGAFIALHVAAADRRVAAVAALAPVTDLLQLREFQPTLAAGRARSLGALELAPRLVGRPVWIAIGERDDRVGTGAAVALARRLDQLERRPGTPPGVVLRLLPTPGHDLPPEAVAEAAAWLAQALRLPADRLSASPPPR